MRTPTSSQKREFQLILDRINHFIQQTIRNNHSMSAEKKIRLMARIANFILANQHTIPPALKRAVQKLQGVEKKVHEGGYPAKPLPSQGGKPPAPNDNTLFFRRKKRGK